MRLLPKQNRKVSSRQQIAIKSVRDGVLQLPGNQYRSVLEVSSVNFELKSEDEQDALIETYQSFLNSLASGLQIIIRIREIDMDKYIGDITERLVDEPEQIYRSQLENYVEFVKSLVTSNKILSRHFYVVIPYAIRGKDDFALAKEQLLQTADIVSKGLSRMGMQSKQLTSLEILDLFYSYYSPAQAKIQPLSDQALSLLSSTYTMKGATA